MGFLLCPGGGRWRRWLPAWFRSLRGPRVDPAGYSGDRTAGARL